MNLDPLSCGSCGASLDIPEGVQFVNCRHCGTALKVQRTDSVAFTEVLQSLKEQSAQLAGNTEVLRIQNEISLLDQEWEQRSAALMVSGKHGRVSVPDKTSSIVGGVVIALFGTGWTILAGSMFPPMALFGLLFVGLGLWNCTSAYHKAERYEILQAEHEMKRRELQARLQSMV